MTISSLIKDLELIKSVHGDLPINITLANYYEESYPATSIEVNKHASIQDEIDMYKFIHNTPAVEFR